MASLLLDKIFPLACALAAAPIPAAPSSIESSSLLLDSSPELEQELEPDLELEPDPELKPGPELPTGRGCMGPVTWYSRSPGECEPWVLDPMGLDPCRRSQLFQAAWATAPIRCGWSRGILWGGGVRLVIYE